MTSALAQNGFPGELRSWRERRRLSQLDLAIRAGTSQRHLSFVEQGRSKPGRTMVLRLAECLELSLRERNRLLLAAGFAPVFPESSLDGAELEPARRALRAILDGHGAFPAVVVRSDGTIVLHNAAADLLFEGVAGELLETPMNAYRLALHPRGMAPRIRNFAVWARHVLDALSSGVTARPGDDLAGLMAELRTYVPTSAPTGDHVGFAVPVQLASVDGDLVLMTTITTFATATDVTLAELRLEAFLPVDPASEAILLKRARRRLDAASAPS